MKKKLKFNRAFLTATKQESATKLAIAVSGGSDSMALCFMLHQCLKKERVELTALIIDHKLRKDSSQEAEKTSITLKKHNIKHHIIPWLGPKPLSNLQEKARIARYTLLTNYCLEHNIPYLATAHQEDDQAENFIMRLNHGSGIYGLAGIPQTNIFNQVMIMRPLLNFSKKELQDFLKEQNIDWIEDPSNQNEKFTRVKARKILVKRPKLTQVLINLTKIMARAKESIEYIVNQSMANLVTFFLQGYASFNLCQFNALPQEIKFRLLLKVLQKINTKEKPPRAERVEKLLNKLNSYKSFSASTLYGCLISRKKDVLIITPEVNNINQSFSIPEGEEGRISWEKKFYLSISKELSTKYGELIIDRVNEHDWPDLKKNLNKEQLITPKAAILTLPAIRNLEKLIAIPHINYYADKYIHNLVKINYSN
jgi:tRNA(Ile)-lysidine synthase